MADSDEDNEKTRVIRRPARTPSPSPVPQQPSSPPAKSADETPTEKIAVPSGDQGEMTRLIGPPRRSPKVALESEPEKPADDSTDPVVGWLVIVSGPGRGGFCRLGYGQNSIGRDAEERVRLEFGDDSISRKKHCFVI